MKFKKISKKNKILVAIGGIIISLIVIILPTVLLINNKKTPQEDPITLKKEPRAPKEKKIFSKTDYNLDFFKNVWRENDVIENIKRIDGIQKYAYGDGKKLKSIYLVDKNALDNNLIKVPSFTDKKFKYSYLDFIDEIKLKHGSWQVAQDSVRYIVQIKYQDAVREVPIIYWTHEKAKKTLDKIDANYLKSISSLYSDQKAWLGEYIDNPQFILKERHHQRTQFLLPFFNHRRYYLPNKEKAFPFYFSLTSRNTRKEGKVFSEYTIYIHNKAYKKIELFHPNNAPLYVKNTIYKPAEKAELIQKWKQQKRITFNEVRKQATSKIFLNNVFKTKEDLINYLHANYGDRKDDWMEKTNSGKTMLFMKNIKLGNNFRLRFADNDATYIDWRDIGGINKMNTPFKGNMYYVVCSFSNLTGINFASVTFFPLGAFVGAPYKFYPPDSYFHIISYEKVYVDQLKMYDWDKKEKIHYNNGNIKDWFNRFYNTVSSKEQRSPSSLSHYDNLKKLYKLLKYDVSEITEKEVIENLKVYYQNNLKSILPSAIELVNYTYNNKTYQEPRAYMAWINYYLESPWDVFIAKDADGNSTWQPNDQDGSLQFSLLITKTGSGQAFNGDAATTKDKIIKIALPPNTFKKQPST